MICTAGVLLSIALFAGCSNNPAGSTAGNTTASVPVTSSTNQGAQDPAPQRSVCVSTPYGNLYYQDQWEAFMKTEQSTEADTVTVLFEVEINGQEFPLFSVIIGGEAENRIGQLTDLSGVKRNVHVSMHQIAEDSELTVEEINRLYAMQEDINYVIQHLR